jgi:hypothetical protein
MRAFRTRIQVLPRSSRKKKGAKPVKAKFQQLLYAYGTPFGVVSTEEGNKKERPDSQRINGTIQAITEDGQLGPVYRDVLDLVDYRGFAALVYRNNGGVQMFDKHLSPLTPVHAWIAFRRWATSRTFVAGTWLRLIQQPEA